MTAHKQYDLYAQYPYRSGYLMIDDTNKSNFN